MGWRETRPARSPAPQRGCRAWGDDLPFPFVGENSGEVEVGCRWGKIQLGAVSPPGMVEASLDEDGLVRLTKGDRRPCNVRHGDLGEMMDENDHRVLIEAVAREMDIPMAHISIGAVDEFANRLEAAVDSEETVELGERISYVPKGGEQVHERMRYANCTVCGEEIGEDDGYLASPGAQIGVVLVWFAFLHEECVEEFCEVLDRVWEYSDDLMTEMI